MLQTGRLHDYFMSALVHTVAARTALHRGDAPRAQAHLVQAARLRPLLTSAIPTFDVQTLLRAGACYLAMDDLAAHEPSAQARDSCSCDPTSASFPTMRRSCNAKLDSTRGGVPGCRRSPRPSCAAPALATHPEALEIGQRLTSPARSRPRRSRSTASSAFSSRSERSSGSKRSITRGVGLARRSRVHPVRGDAVGNEPARWQPAQPHRGTTVPPPGVASGAGRRREGLRRPAVGPEGMPVRSRPSEPRRVGVGLLLDGLDTARQFTLRVMLAPARRPRIADEVLLSGRAVRLRRAEAGLTGIALHDWRRVAGVGRPKVRLG